MAIKINWQDLQKRIISWQEVERVILDETQIRPERYIIYWPFSTSAESWVLPEWWTSNQYVSIITTGNKWVTGTSNDNNWELFYTLPSRMWIKKFTTNMSFFWDGNTGWNILKAWFEFYKKDTIGYVNSIVIGIDGNSNSYLYWVPYDVSFSTIFPALWWDYEITSEWDLITWDSYYKFSLPNGQYIEWTNTFAVDASVISMKIYTAVWVSIKNVTSILDLY